MSVAFGMCCSRIERVDARYHDVILPIHDEHRLLDFPELTISIRFGDYAPASNRCCLGTHGRHRRRHILVSARMTTLPKGATGCLACLTRREEKVEKILGAVVAFLLRWWAVVTIPLVQGFEQGHALRNASTTSFMNSSCIRCGRTSI